MPEEILPKAIQQQLAPALSTEAPGRREVPQVLRDALSNLPPFNYYLLFAITCHLSLLLSYENKNKMTLDNLYRCFNQSLKLDGRIFFTLVGDWRQCWQGCYTENDYLRAEFDHLNPSPSKRSGSIAPQLSLQETLVDERATTSSSGGSNPTATGRSTPELQRPSTSHAEPSLNADDVDTQMLSPVKTKHRSSSDVTGMNLAKFQDSVKSQ